MRLATTEVTAFSSRAAAEMLPSRATRRNAPMFRIVFRLALAERLEPTVRECAQVRRRTRPTSNESECQVTRTIERPLASCPVITRRIGLSMALTFSRAWPPQAASGWRRLEQSGV